MSNLFFDEGQPKQGHKVLLATTAYDVPAAAYTFAIQRSREALHKAGIETAYLLLQGNCHVDDARNNVIQQFLLSDCDDLIFLDADVSWQPADLIALCNADADLCGGIYPYRREGMAEKMPVFLIPDQEPEPNGLLQVAGLPTGFMKIRRHVLEKMAETADHYVNRAERRSKVPILFERTFEGGARWGGDITFCRKWHKLGGKMYALPELRLGHAAKVIITDSLGAMMRRNSHNTLKYVVDKLRTEPFTQATINHLIEARQYINNPWGAIEDVLSLAILEAQKAQGPIIETGSGLSTILMAAVTDQPIYCLEHDAEYAKKLEAMALVADVDMANIHIVNCKIKDGWYDLPENMPTTFALGLNDGPPRDQGYRMGFFEHFPDTETIIADDADDPGYGEALSLWASSHDREINFIERSALIRRAA